MENEICKKKTAAPDTSVGADDGQPLHNSTKYSISTFEQEINGDFQNSAESLDEIYRRMQRLTDPHYLHTISMTELYQTAYQSRSPIIDGLLYAGAYILAGAPKIGKSFLVAQIAYHVSTGQALWGCEVHPGTVLYLALEDDFQRIQSRMFMMYGVNDTDRLHFATVAGKIGNGLDEQLENFVCEHPDTKLIIIDTMDVIRDSIENRADDVCRVKEELRTTPVYPHSAAYAREHGELEQYRASNNVNLQCKESIEAAVREHFDGMYLSHDAAKGVIETYGMERVALVLANTVQLQDWDGRYSRRNKEWAKTIPNENPETVRCGYVLNSHPAVLDGFIDLVREEQQRSRTQGEKLQPSRPSVRDKLKQELPAHKPAASKKREPER